ncbi:hypothetical protein OAE15_01470 [Verrucomicrobiales bacterium]|nr:hypothetical protein [Verrucomicrobiales bacterium]
MKRQSFHFSLVDIDLSTTGLAGTPGLVGRFTRCPATKAPRLELE